MGTRVVPTEQVIDLLPKGHLVPSRMHVRDRMSLLEAEGQIVPLVLDDWWSGSIALVYAAVELGWPTMLVTDTEVTSG